MPSENLLPKTIVGHQIDDLGITDLMLLDYKNAWEYYKINFDERREIAARVYTFVGIPFFVISTLSFLTRAGVIKFEGAAGRFQDFSYIYGSFAALLITAYGLTQLRLLALETKVSKDYLSFLDSTRRYIGIVSPEMRPFLKYREFQFWNYHFLNHPLFHSLRDRPYGQEALSLVETYTSRFMESYERSKIARGRWFQFWKGDVAYWRASSAILIVSVSFGSTIGMLLIYLSKSTTHDLLAFTSGICSAAISFILISWRFRAHSEFTWVGLDQNIVKTIKPNLRT